MPCLRQILVAAFIAILAYLYRCDQQSRRVVQMHHPALDLDHSRPPTVDEDLVTNSNPARNDDGMDYERCARLHNYLVEYGWTASGRRPEGLARRSFFDVYGDTAEALRPRLDASLVLFLSSITMAEEFEVPFFFWVSGIAQPSDMLPTSDASVFVGADNNPDRFIVLYPTNTGLCGHSVGLIYDQVCHRATVTLGIEDVDFVMPVEDHEDLWYPLETVLSNWIEMVHIGKITASEDEAPNEKYGPWTWQPYSAVQVDRAVAAFNRLVAAIEDRMPATSLLPARDAPLLTDADIDAAAVPRKCFARSFLTAIQAPRFASIAPGLLVPHDPAAFTASQRLTVIDASSSSDSGFAVPPVLLFIAANGRTANFDSPNRYESRNPFIPVYSKAVAPGDHSVPAGLYSESVDRSAADNAEEGFRLILPFGLRTQGEEHGGFGARKSNGQLVSKDSVAELFQHGFKPFGGEWWRAQRLERLLDRWTELVETGVWKVGDGSVQGSIHMFRDADRGRWRDYWIPPGW